MHWLKLPDPRKNISAAFVDLASARNWLAQQPHADPQQTLAALALQVEAIDGSALDPAPALELLGFMRKAAIPLLGRIEPGFSRQALPLAGGEYRAFELVSRFWQRLGVAYLRRLWQAGERRSLVLNRAAGALRLAVYSHFLAAYECSPELDHLLCGALLLAARDGLLKKPLPDVDFPRLGEFTVSGQLAWTFLLRQIDPYRLTVEELTVTNRAFGRWRELAEFRRTPQTTPEALNLDLQALFGGVLPAEAPRWLSIGPVDLKLGKRLDALEAGSTPDQLKLGRELTAPACRSLLAEIRLSLGAPERQQTDDIDRIDLSFGGDDAYAVLRSEYLNAAGDSDLRSAALAQHRMALFGFDRAESAGAAVSGIAVDGEAWQQQDGMARRLPASGGKQHQAPCLVAARIDGQPYLGVLFGLRVTADGALSGGLYWYDGEIEAGSLRRAESLAFSERRTPAFLIREDAALSLVLPATAGIRPGVALTLDGISLERLRPGEILERGADFIRYACQPL
ncbi:MAG: hypothetical protein LBE62_04545 [Azonexus sp.]|jgi:hypothetical protein|nr:hypothetical protein [Azonexus sp.]